MNKRRAIFTTGAIALLGLVVMTSLGSDEQAEKTEMNTQSKQAPVACKLGALDPAQRARHQSLRKQLNENVQEVRELPDGYALRLPAETRVILATAEWVTLERLCCPFFVFEMEIGSEGDAMWLRLTGGEGVKEFLKAELGSKR